MNKQEERISIEMDLKLSRHEPDEDCLLTKLKRMIEGGNNE